MRAFLLNASSCVISHRMPHQWVVATGSSGQHFRPGRRPQISFTMMPSSEPLFVPSPSLFRSSSLRFPTDSTHIHPDMRARPARYPFLRVHNRTSDTRNFFDAYLPLVPTFEPRAALKLMRNSAVSSLAVPPSKTPTRSNISVVKARNA